MVAPSGSIAARNVVRSQRRHKMVAPSLLIAFAKCGAFPTPMNREPAPPLDGWPKWIVAEQLALSLPLGRPVGLCLRQIGFPSLPQIGCPKWNVRCAKCDLLGPSQGPRIPTPINREQAPPRDGCPKYAVALRETWSCEGGGQKVRANSDKSRAGLG